MEPVKKLINRKSWKRGRVERQMNGSLLSLYIKQLLRDGKFQVEKRPGKVILFSWCIIIKGKLHNQQKGTGDQHRR